MRALLDIVMILLNFAQLVIFVYIIFSWLISFRVLDTRNQFVSTVWRILYQMTEPVLRPIRNAMPKGWAIDLSPLIVILAIIFQCIMSFTVYGKHTYAIGSNEEAARMSGINVKRHKVLVYMIASMLAAFAGIVLSSKSVTAQAGMGEFYELFAIAMAVIGGISLQGGRGSIFGTVLGAMVLGVIQTGFIYIKLDGSYQLMAMGGIIIAAVILDQYRQRVKA